MTTDNSVLHEQISTLTGQIADLETRLSAAQATEKTLREEADRFRALLESSPESIVVYDNEGKALYINPAFERIFGWSREALLGKRIDFVPPENLPETQEGIRRLFSGADVYTSFESRRFTSDKQLIDVHVDAALVFTADGTKSGMIVTLRDITKRKKLESEQQRLNEELMQIQNNMLLELSTPLIPISNEIVVMPLIGSIDARRIQQVIDKLAHEIPIMRARVAILDITGVPIVDTHIASGLIQVTQVLRLLGAQVIITGVRPEVAQTMVTIGVTLENVVTVSTLQAGIAHAMHRFDQHTH